ncbi:MAG TPA: Rieske (2Fe-2S) protein [Acidimicrobiales bacterium]|nr:Rieske (2Fe-2S) protein [Acidimicrobiales bacterium]
MDPRRLPDAIESASFLDAPADALMQAVSKAIPSGPLKDVVSGTWLGHPLHPALTDLPIGFWTSAWILDLIGGRRSANAARMLVGLGIASAIPTAVSGASDWADTAEPEKRVGLVHATANSIALACYVVSFVHRVRGRRAKGVVWGWFGAGAATVGGALGGHLVDALGIGVDNTAFDPGPRDWTAAGSAAELREGRPVTFSTGGVDVLVVREGDRLLALADRCTHRGGRLHEGDVVVGCVECPWHQSRFRLEDGEVAQGPATRPQPRYEARVLDGVVEVRRR